MLKKSMYHNRNSIILLILLLFSTSTFALNSDAQKTTHMTADKVVYNRNSHISTYIGHVKFSQGTTSLTADKVIVYDRENSNKIYKIVAFGKRAHYSTLPEGKKALLHAKANTIKYYPQKNIAILIGNAEVTQKDNSMSGMRITYNTKKDTILLTPKTKGRARVVFQP